MDTFEVRLERDVLRLARDIGTRNDFDEASYAGLRESASFLERELAGAGFDVHRHAFVSGPSGRVVENVVAERRGSAVRPEIVVLGAHYDSVRNGPGANDNGSGVAALLAVARSLATFSPERTMRLVAFANEEPPHTRKPSMGSLSYARRCRDLLEPIAAMVSIETVGSPGARTLAFVGNLRSRALAREASRAFGEQGAVRARAISLPGFLPGIKSSDHWAFWRCGFRAVMLTDGGPLRYRHYHRRSDTVEHVEYAKVAAVARGLVATARALTEIRHDAV